MIEINNNYKDKKLLFTKIYKYLWYVARFSNYCLYNRKEYSLHTYDTIKYNFAELDEQWKIVKKSIIKDLKEMRKEYVQSCNNFTNDAC